MAENEVKSAAPKKRTTRKAAPKTVKGRVVKCLALNIRETPSLDGVILGTIKAGTEVKIYKDQSTDDFYKIEDGFCYKPYVEVE